MPALQAGSYSVTVSLAGFKTAEIKGIRVALGQPVTANITLEVGTLEQTVTVTSSSELVNTETATVDVTLNADQINRMPTPTRNALNAVAFLPGVNTSTIVRESTINGLPQSFVSMTIDGASTSDNYNRHREFFAMITPRQDAVEAATVTLAAGGAQIGGGSGAVTVAFQTRSGSNRFQGSAYEYFRHEALNSNYYFNEVNGLPKNELRFNQFGARAGGRVVRDKTFYSFITSSSATRTASLARAPR